MAKGKSPLLPILGIAGLGVFAWLNWTRIKKFSGKILADIGGEQPQWVNPSSSNPVYAPGTPGTLGPPGTLGDPAVPEVVRFPISDLALGPICRDFPQICGLGGGG